MSFEETVDGRNQVFFKELFRLLTWLLEESDENLSLNIHLSSMFDYWKYKLRN
jgi:hypothetical protein